MSEHWTEIEVPSFFNKYALSIDNNIPVEVRRRATDILRAGLRFEGSSALRDKEEMYPVYVSSMPHPTTENLLTLRCSVKLFLRC